MPDDKPAPSGCIHGFPDFTAVECEYSLSHWSHRKISPAQVISDYVTKLNEVHMSIQHDKSIIQLLDVSYGDLDREKIDFYGRKTMKKSPVFAFIHGGYWQDGCRKRYSVMVPSMVNRGVVVAVIGYSLAFKSSIDETVLEISRALEFLGSWCEENCSEGLYLAGHCAGAHLAAMGLLRLGKKLTKLKGLFLLSGIFDLQPLLETYINRPLRLTPDVAKRNSPESMVEELCRLCGEAQITVVAAEHDSPVFKENSNKLYTKLCQSKAQKKPVFLVIPNEDHFSIVEQLDNPDFVLTKLLLDGMQCSKESG